MELIYYKSPKGNVGDDLNPWLWPKIFGDKNHFESVNFIGIGSILDRALEKWIINNNKKVVFGAGVRSFFYDQSQLTNADILFVRGPISSKALSGVKFITDSAYCLKFVENLKLSKSLTYKISYVPYFTHMDSIDWNLFEILTGIKVISPFLSVDNFLYEISKSEKVLSSAMHGAIFADMLRIPWCRVRLEKHGGEPLLTSELKWADWSSSMNISLPTLNIGLNLDVPRSSKIKEILKLIYLKRSFLNETRYTLSRDAVFLEKLGQLSEVIDLFKSRYRLSGP